MADFTHTITVSATLDGGRAIYVSFVGTIEDVYEVQRGIVQSSSTTLVQGGLPNFNMPIELFIAQCQDGQMQINVSTSADTAQLQTMPGGTVSFCGPYGVEVDTSGAATTNANMVTEIDFANGSGKVDWIALKTPVS